ncbi:MAG TPA: hypothetical protein VFP59_17100 [Candidatus Angelobacter sp.]|nr:hypothetical protein [Candidatus Angelobacter sp.]
MLKPALITAVLLLGASAVHPQSRKAAPTPQKQPPIRVNVLNVCTPGADDQAILKAALAKARERTLLAGDFEIARGRATLKDAPPSRYVRLRRDLEPQSPWETAQYSMSRDPKSTIETLVLRMRDPKNFHELSIEDQVSSDAASAAVVLASDTPASRIRVERIGKSSVALAQCPDVNQSAYQPLFAEASQIMDHYRKEMGLRTEFRADINWLDGGGVQKSAKAQKRR